MAANIQLNMIGMVSPFCLLAFKAALARLKPRQVLEVCVRDPDVMADLVRLLHHSTDRLLEQVRVGDHYRIRVERAGRAGTKDLPAGLSGPGHEEKR